MNARTDTPTPYIPAPRITTVAGYLLTRLTQAGLASVFGVPGDYNLGLLDAIAGRPNLAWIGMATEQGAGYAADSYARQRGIGALVTTFGAGELSALNAVAGACAASVPVVHIVGTPALAAREAGKAGEACEAGEAGEAGATLHHNLPGRDYGHFARMAAEVTAAQADLRPATAPEEIDRVLATALRTSRPVYLTIPADMADMPVLAPMGRLQVAAEDADPAVMAAFTRHAHVVLDTAASASLLVGHLAARHRATALVRDLAAAGNLPVAVLATAKGDFPESDPPGSALADLPDPESAPQARDGRLTQRSLWAGVQDLLRPGDLLLADQGAAFYGAAGLTLPDGATLIGQPLWASAGWTVPAALGASLAAPDRRVVLIAGDSAMQQTAAELGTLLGQGLAPVVIVLDNAGYRTGRALSHRDAEYHDIPAWDWTALPAAVAPARGTVALRVSTSRELTRALNVADHHTAAGRAVLIEAVLGAADAPPLLRELSRALAHR